MAGTGGAAKPPADPRRRVHQPCDQVVIGMSTKLVDTLYVACFIVFIVFIAASGSRSSGGKYSAA